MEKTNNNALEKLIASGGFNTCNAETFALVYDEYAPALFGMLCKVSSSETAAEDLLSQTFIIAWNKKSTFNNNIPLLSWLMNVARQETGFKLNNNHPEKSKGSASIVHINNQSNGINAQEPDVFDLMYCKGMSYKEVSMLTHLTVDEIKLKIRGAIKGGLK